MSYIKIFEIVKDSLRRIQEETGNKCPRITPKTIPVLDIPGFDSVLALLATIEIEHEMKVDFDYTFELFVDNAEQKVFSVENAVKRVLDYLANKKDSSNEKE